MELERYRLCAEAAKKNAKAELVLKNANVVNVFTGEVIKGDVAIAEGIVVGVGQFEGIEERDRENTSVRDSSTAISIWSLRW